MSVLSEPEVTIKIGADTKPLEKAAKDVKKTLDKVGDDAKKTGSKIDEAFKAATGKVQESLGPLGKLLGPTAIGIGAVGLALGALGAAASKAFSAVKEGASEIKNLGTSSGFAANQLQTLTTRAAAADEAMTRLKVSSGLMFSGLVEALTPAINTLADLQAFAGAGGAVVFGGALNGSNDPTAGAFEVGQKYVPGKSGPARQAEALAKRRAGLKKQRDDQDRMQREADAKAAAYRARVAQLDALGSMPTLADFTAIQQERFDRDSAWAGQAGAMPTLEQLGVNEYRAPSRAKRKPRTRGASSAFDFSGLAGAAGSAIPQLMTGNVGGAISGLASTAASTLLGPIAGPIVGGVIDGLVGAIFAEDEGSKLRREAMERTRERWRTNQRDRAWQRRQNLPEFAQFSGPSAGATIVNVSFNAPVSSRRAARELADVLRGGG